jgi:hypothetical protein
MPVRLQAWCAGAGTADRDGSGPPLGVTGRSDDARALLAPLVDTFHQGLELPDLRDARAVLEA